MSVKKVIFSMIYFIVSLIILFFSWLLATSFSCTVQCSPPPLYMLGVQGCTIPFYCNLLTPIITAFILIVIYVIGFFVFRKKSE